LGRLSVLTCNVSDGYKHSAKSIDVQVIGKPVVSISPPTKVVNHGESVTIECRITSVHSVMTSLCDKVCQWLATGQ
jgi:hypothetical protein